MGIILVLFFQFLALDPAILLTVLEAPGEPHSASKYCGGVIKSHSYGCLHFISFIVLII